MFRPALLAITAAVFSACSTTPKPQPAPDAPRWSVNRPAYDAAKPCDVRVEISLAKMEARLLDKAGATLVEMDCSPGVPEHPSPVGKFRVMEKKAEKRSNLYGQYVDKTTGEVVVARAWEHKGPPPPNTELLGIMMPFWMRLTDWGVGMHVGGFHRGVSTSHGCIRCMEEPQRLFFEKVPVGGEVSIRRD